MNDLTFQQLADAQARELHVRAVWEELTTHLDGFIEKDGATAAIGISSEGQGRVVPQDILLDIKSYLATKIDSCNARIESRNKTTVKETNEQAKAQGKEKKGKSRG